MKTTKFLAVLTLTAVLVACGGSKTSEAPASGGSKKDGAPARGGNSAVSKATDEVPTSNRKEMYLDRYRFGDSTDADGIVVRESDWIPAGSTAAISLFLRNAPAGSELRLVWNDVGAKSSVGEEVKPVGDKGFVTFKQARSLPEGKYRAELYFREPATKEWKDLGGHDFKVGKKS